MARLSFTRYLGLEVKFNHVRTPEHELYLRDPPLPPPTPNIITVTDLERALFVATTPRPSPVSLPFKAKETPQAGPTDPIMASALALSAADLMPLRAWERTDSPLLALPRELRDEIWAYSVDSGPALRVSASRKHGEKLLMMVSGSDVTTTAGNGVETGCSLVLVRKEVRSEVLPLIFKTSLEGLDWAHMGRMLSSLLPLVPNATTPPTASAVTPLAADAATTPALPRPLLEHAGLYIRHLIMRSNDDVLTPATLAAILRINHLQTLTLVGTRCCHVHHFLHTTSSNACDHRTCPVFLQRQAQTTALVVQLRTAGVDLKFKREGDELWPRSPGAVTRLTSAGRKISVVDY
ncbi:hypothetical protein BU16DRAFT_532485 [Lophium mytilinum]|uniref:Uncharacterized protein n=1 Tax=Lophium mytilinum TaxID=390894 RepID=A0A6A6RC98_9PEZI|nr:hypothetical protein BU16DRAFT_532485 [Lophium mytilinum]